MSAEHNKAAIHRYIEAHNRHNLDEVFSYFSPHILSHGVPGSNMPVGIDEIKAYFVALSDAVPDLKVSLHDTIAEGDKVVVRFTVSGMQTKEFMGQPGGQQVAWPIITVYRFEDGNIAEVWS